MSRSSSRPKITSGKRMMLSLSSIWLGCWALREPPPMPRDGSKTCPSSPSPSS
ncbi:hypothetical protein FKM82_004004 [Ascaphus truei]